MEPCHICAIIFIIGPRAVWVRLGAGWLSKDDNNKTEIQEIPHLSPAVSLHTANLNETSANICKISSRFRYDLKDQKGQPRAKHDTKAQLKRHYHIYGIYRNLLFITRLFLFFRNSLFNLCYYSKVLTYITDMGNSQKAQCPTFVWYHGGHLHKFVLSTAPNETATVLESRHEALKQLLIALHRCGHSRRYEP